MLILPRSAPKLAALAVAALAVGLASPKSAEAGRVFLIGHDSDFHAQPVGPNASGAQHIIQDGLAYVRNGSTAPILFLETDPGPNIALGDHNDSEQGLIASGFTAANTPGNHYVRVTAAQFAAANLSQFSALFVPSDHGGSLTGTDLQALDNRAGDIAVYLAAGGGVMALAEDGMRAPSPTNPQPQNYGFLPISIGSAALEQAESGYQLSAMGSTLGLTVADINGNASHSFFTGNAGLSIVDTDPSSHVISLFGTVNVVPEPSSLALAGIGLLGLLGLGRLRRGRAGA